MLLIKPEIPESALRGQVQLGLRTLGYLSGIPFSLHCATRSIYVVPAVHRELLQAERMGFSWVDCVTPVVEPLPLTTEESQAVERLVRQHPQLGSGEVESFVLAQTHRLLCLTNDRQAKAVAHRLSLSYLDLEEILRALKTKAILATEALAALIDQIEQKGRTRIKAKEAILNN